ncbi:MAG TPA: DinB family protein [Bryobacteraceae bacterium]|jgi:uncharacterized damage-inducible protein DinB|nr:DinB family protein [Bryobacteraceae bacterium]
MRLIAAALFAVATLAAQSGQPAGRNQVVETSERHYAEAKADVLRSAEKVPEDLYSFRPTPDVRTFGQLIAHEADGQYELCGPATGKTVDKNIEDTVKGKPALIAALKEAFAYCDAIYAKMDDANAVSTIIVWGHKSSKIGVMDYNTSHTMEHYGNLVTYMRLKGIVPPTSEPKK